MQSSPKFLHKTLHKFSHKIFIIGLPRTATTSVCLTMLDLGFKTAHTAYTQQTVEQAQVIADTPIFTDYQSLDLLYPQAKFIYLERESVKWVPSIRQLLQRMQVNLQRQDGGFNPTIKRCYQEVFGHFTEKQLRQDDFLIECYHQHKTAVTQYFKDRSQDLLMIDVSQKDSFMALLNFLSIQTNETTASHFALINVAGKVTAWNKIKHPFKVSSTKAGRVDPVIHRK